MLILFLSVVLLILSGFLYMKQNKFGKLPQGKRLEKIEQSPNYKDGAFQNLSHTPSLEEGTSMIGIMVEFLFKKVENKVPLTDIPSVKTDIKSLDRNQDILIWFGHSSYYFQLNGK